MTVIVLEDDRSLRLLQILLDPAAPRELSAAYADYLAHDLPDLSGWCDTLRVKIPRLFPAEVRIVATQEELLAKLPGAEVAIFESLELGATEMAVADKLRVVQKFGDRTVGVDIEACKTRGVHVRTQRRRINVVVAEHAMMLLQALAKQLPLINGLVTVERVQKSGRVFRPYDTRHTPNSNWARIGGLRTLHGSTLGVLGLGEIGSEMANLGRGCGMQVIYHQRHPLPASEEARRGVAYCGFEELLARADFLSIHLPMNARTRGMMDRAAIARMKRGAILINTSRAEIVEAAPLLDALDSEHLGGAGLDVLYREPTTDDDPLLNRHNVIVTPHLAGGSRLSRLVDAEEMLLGICSVLQ